MGVVALGALLALLVASVGPAAADTRAERARVKAERAQVAAQVDALQGEQAQITEALAALDANVRAQQEAAATAARAAEVSAAEAAAARQAADASAAELATMRARLTRYAVDAYVDPPSDDLLRRFEAGSAQEDATRRALVAMRSGRDADLVDQMRTVQRRLEDDVRRAERARVAAEADQRAAEASIASLTSARDEQQRFATEVRQRLDTRLADAAVLAQLDAGLAERIRAEEAAVAEAVARLAPPAAPVAPTSPGSPTPGPAPGTPPGGGSAPPPSTSPPTTSRPVVRPPTPPLRTVGGITVHADIADRLASLLSDARSAGIVLGGSGYRSIDSQIALRRQNCGTSDYAIWEMPPDLCSPPTARPGLSMHERGLAVDFTANGRFITSRSDPGFVWLAGNAARYGFYNLPSEPWHWSVTGG